MPTKNKRRVAFRKHFTSEPPPPDEATKEKLEAAAHRERAEALAEQSIHQLVRGFDNVNPKDYAGAMAFLKMSLAGVTDDMAQNKLDTGGVMVLGAACVALVREATLKWPEKVPAMAKVRESTEPGEPET